MNLLVTICARGGSKGIPGKNIRAMHGKPLITWSIEHARAYANEVGADIELSTDDAEITSVAAGAGLPTEYVRPELLANDAAGKLETIQDIVKYAEEKNAKTYDYILDLDVTSPLRTLEDLRTAFAMLENDTNARNLFSVSPPAHNPYFDMVEPNADGYFELCKKPEQAMLARQQGPEVYELNASFYFYRRSFFEQNPLVLMGNSLVYAMPHMCFELDEMKDFLFLEYLLQKNMLDFDFQ